MIVWISGCAPFIATAAPVQTASAVSDCPKWKSYRSRALSKGFWQQPMAQPAGTGPAEKAQPAVQQHSPIAAADRRIGGPFILWIASVVATAVIRPSAARAIPSLRVRGAVICASVSTADAVVAARRAAVIPSIIAPVPSVAAPSIPSVVRVCIPTA